MTNTKALRDLVLASHNAGKVAELKELVAPLHIAVVSAAELHLPEPEETGATFEDNAALKAQSAAQIAGRAALADDSGLCVPALDGAPGIYSARWAGPDKDFAAAMQTVRAKLEEAGLTPEGAAAYFVCVLALAVPGEETLFFRGEAHGHLTFPPRGHRGFGYDPIFVPKHPKTAGKQTFAELDPVLKQRISHRAQAFDRLLHYLHRRTG